MGHGCAAMWCGDAWRQPSGGARGQLGTWLFLQRASPAASLRTLGSRPLQAARTMSVLLPIVDKEERVS